MFNGYQIFVYFLLDDSTNTPRLLITENPLINDSYSIINEPEQSCGKRTNALESEVLKNSRREKNLRSQTKYFLI